MGGLCSRGPDSNFPPTLDNFSVIRSIGRGAFGKVCIVQRRSTKQYYALKYMSKRRCIEKGVASNVIRELRILTKISHPFIVNLWYTFQDASYMYMVSDLLLGGDLRFHLNQQGRFAEDRSKLYVCELSLAIEYLHEQGIVHRDIKPENILLDEQGHAHLTDFNLATQLSAGERATSFSGTRPYMAPEIFESGLGLVNGYDEKVDWWSLGITFYEMLRGRCPYELTGAQLPEQALLILRETAVPYPTHWPTDLLSFFSQLLSVDSHRRIRNLAGIKMHAYTARIDFAWVLGRKAAPVFVPCKEGLNCDPMHELEERIVESTPIHRRRNGRQRGCKESVTDPALLEISESFIEYSRKEPPANYSDDDESEASKLARIQAKYPVNTFNVAEDVDRGTESKGRWLWCNAAWWYPGQDYKSFIKLVQNPECMDDPNYQSYHEDQPANGSNPVSASVPAQPTPIIAVGVSEHDGSTNEDQYLFHERSQSASSLTAEQAFVHMVKAMLGTGLLSLPLAFKYSGLMLGLILIVMICVICLYCMRQVVWASHFVCSRSGRELVDYANIMRLAVEMGPDWIRNRGYFFKQLVNVNMFIAQLGFCCVYFVFMADNLEDFFRTNLDVKLSISMWMILLLVPILAICSIRRLSILAPFAMAANVVYLAAAGIVLYFFFTNLRPIDSLPWFGKITDLPLFFGTVMFAFEGVAVIMPIENRMHQPGDFIRWNGVLNSSCMVVLAIFAMTGFYGYLALGDTVKDTATLNLPLTPFYQTLKIMFVLCIMISYPLQFYVPMERVEKWVTRKIPAEKQTLYIYAARFGGVMLTCMLAEAIPHLALFISLIGAFSGASLALVFPPCIELLVLYAQRRLDLFAWLKNGFLLTFALIGFSTGTYSALSEISQKLFHETA
ncbi:unnamed protein product, partial [Mesorhabditis spiculigera]